ncbi:MAG: glycoside hydrolase [Actinomycetota bacterium]|nr:glycoside hydrolase [Actinomycetota bacterium]
MKRAVALVVSVVSVITAGPARGAPAGLRVVQSSAVSGPVAFPTGCSASQDANEPQVAVDPRDPSHLVATYDLGAGGAAVIASSSNGGVTWNRLAQPVLAECGSGDKAQGQDPSLAIASDGLVWTQQGYFDPDRTRAGHDAVREYSVVYGKDVSVADIGGEEALQRGWIALGDAPGTAYVATDHIDYAGTYVPGSPLSSVTLRATADGGKSWQTVSTIDTDAPGHVLIVMGLQRTQGALVAVVADVFLPAAAPELVATLGSTAPGTAYAYRSTDGGRTWSRGDPIGQLPQCCLADAAVGPDGTLYVTWTEAADRSDKTGDDVVIARSSDGGQTWQSSVAAHSVGPFPTSAVAVTSSGTVGLLWYATDPAQSGDIVPRFTVSRDEGNTWSEPVALASSFNPNAISSWNDTGPLGAYQDVAGLPDGFGVVFTQGGSAARGGASEVVYAHVIVGG